MNFLFLIVTILFCFYLKIDHVLADSKILQHIQTFEKKIHARQIANIDFIYLINLDIRRERLDKAISQLGNYGIFPHRFSAIYGWGLDENIMNDIGLKFQPGMTFKNKSRSASSNVWFPLQGVKKTPLDQSSYGKVCFHSRLTLGAIGCSLSHLSVLKDAYDSGYEIIWVLEDDFEIKDNPHYLAQMIHELDNQVGRCNWDVLYTDMKYGNEHLLCCWRPDMPAFNQGRLLKKRSLNENFIKIGCRNGTYSMVITRSGIKKILDFNINYGIFLPYDNEIALDFLHNFF